MKTLFYVLIVLQGVCSVHQLYGQDNRVIAEKLRFYFYENATTTTTYLVDNQEVIEGSENGAFWQDTNMAQYHNILRALLKDPNNGGDGTLQNSVANVLSTTQRPIMINLWNDTSAFNPASVRAPNKPCQDNNRYVVPCSSSWLMAQNTHWSGFMHLGNHYPTQFGLDWFKNTFMQELYYTIPSNGYRIVPVTEVRNRLRLGIDNTVRSFFNRSGTRVSGANISFMDAAQFAQELINNQDFLRNQLVMIFASNPLDDSDFNAISRFYGVLTFTLSRARTFVDEGLSRGYFERYETFGSATRITPEAFLMKYIAAFTTGEQSRASRRIIMKEPSLVETMTHEIIHFYTHNNYMEMTEKSAYADVFIDGVKLTQILKEGVTELFSREVMLAHYNQLGTLSFDAYQPETEKAIQLFFHIGHQTMVDAYFGGNTNAINAVEQAIVQLRAGTNIRSLRSYLVQLIQTKRTEYPITDIIRQEHIIFSGEPSLDRRKIERIVDKAIENGYFSSYNAAPGASTPSRIPLHRLAELFLNQLDYQQP